MGLHLRIIATSIIIFALGTIALQFVMDYSLENDIKRQQKEERQKLSLAGIADDEVMEKFDYIERRAKFINLDMVATKGNVVVSGIYGLIAGLTVGVTVSILVYGYRKVKEIFIPH